MSRFRLRLIALFTLTAYFVANTHAGLAIGACLPVAAEKSSEANQRKSSPCSHCAKRTTATIQLPQGIVVSSRECTNDFGCHSCPCCPKSPSGSPCPMPGGCAFCSVAKVPMVTPDVRDFARSEHVEDIVIVQTGVKLPSLAGELFRPPRA